MDQYVENVILKNLDEKIQTVVNKRIERLLKAPSWSNDGQIDGVPFEQYVKEKTEKTLEEAISKNAKNILARKIAEII